MSVLPQLAVSSTLTLTDMSANSPSTLLQQPICISRIHQPNPPLTQAESQLCSIVQPYNAAPSTLNWHYARQPPNMCNIRPEQLI
eukprot:3095588-Amphidinium_carterae.1